MIEASGETSLQNCEEGHPDASLPQSRGKQENFKEFSKKLAIKSQSLTAHLCVELAAIVNHLTIHDRHLRPTR